MKHEKIMKLAARTPAESLLRGRRIGSISLCLPSPRQFDSAGHLHPSDLLNLDDRPNLNQI